MRFRIKNIGTIEMADIDIDGITIIAGENNVGKSTVGKALYAFLHDMSSWKELYDNICSTKIESFLYQNSTTLEDWCMKISGAKRRRTNKNTDKRTLFSMLQERHYHGGKAANEPKNNSRSVKDTIPGLEVYS